MRLQIFAINCLFKLQTCVDDVEFLLCLYYCVMQHYETVTLILKKKKLNIKREKWQKWGNRLIFIQRGVLRDAHFSVAQVSAAAGGIRSVRMKAPPTLTGLVAALRAGNCEDMGTDRMNYPSDDFYEFPMKVMTPNWYTKETASTYGVQYNRRCCHRQDLVQIPTVRNVLNLLKSGSILCLNRTGEHSCMLRLHLRD